MMKEKVILAYSGGTGHHYPDSLAEGNLRL